MLEGIFCGVAGAAAVVMAHWSGTQFRRRRQTDKDAKFSITSVPSYLKSCFSDRVESTRELFSECKAEFEATQVAIDEVRYPSADNVIRIY